jgi:hypothetical protein
MRENQLAKRMQCIGGNHSLGGIFFSRIGQCLVFFELNAKRNFQY